MKKILFAAAACLVLSACTNPPQPPDRDADALFQRDYRLDHYDVLTHCQDGTKVYITYSGRLFVVDRVGLDGSMHYNTLALGVTPEDYCRGQ